LVDANNAVAERPDEADGFELREEVYETLAQRDRAIADYRAALKLDPKAVEARDGLRRLGVSL
jgi:Tfp pilus assembly protein PilF